ncbi:hypothetical protein, partial [Methylobacterium haplocladii]
MADSEITPATASHLRLPQARLHRGLGGGVDLPVEPNDAGAAGLRLDLSGFGLGGAWVTVSW